MKRLLLGLLLLVSLNGQASNVELDWDRFLEQSGVADVLRQSDYLISQEIRNLQKAPLDLTAEQLQVISVQLQRELGAEQLKQAMVVRLQQAFPVEQMAQMMAIVESGNLQQLQALQLRLSDPDVRKAVRAYRYRLSQENPDQQRLALLANLDQELQQSALETELKVELRKQLLASVTAMKTREVFPEDLLERQLQPYRQTVQGEISVNALYAYLYLLKRTPSDNVQSLVDAIDRPAFDTFMSLCREALQDSFRAARLQMLQTTQVAGN